MGGNKNNKETKDELVLSKKELKKIKKLEAQIPFYEGRRQPEEAEKIRQQITAIVDKAKAEQGF